MFWFLMHPLWSQKGKFPETFSHWDETNPTCAFLSGVRLYFNRLSLKLHHRPLFLKQTLLIFQIQPKGSFPEWRCCAVSRCLFSGNYWTNCYTGVLLKVVRQEAAEFKLPQFTTSFFFSLCLLKVRSAVRFSITCQAPWIHLWVTDGWLFKKKKFFTWIK